MSHESLETIIQNLQSWKDLCLSQDADKIAKTLNQGVGFYFKIPQEMQEQIREAKKLRSSDDIFTCYHAYVGVSSDGILKYYMIHSNYDTEEQFEKGIRPYIFECKISNNYHGADQDISDEEARRLIGNWKKFHPIWIPLQTISEVGMYRAFTVPDDDIPLNEELKGFFALKENLSEDQVLPNFSGDLVICDLDNQTLNGTTFSDLARPVPPFKKGTVTAYENFYLMTCPVVTNESL